MMNHDDDEEDDNSPNSLFDRAKFDLEAAKADLDLQEAELEMARERYNDANSRCNDALQRFLQADLSRVCRWNQMVSFLYNKTCKLIHNSCTNNTTYTEYVFLAVPQVMSMEGRKQRRHARTNHKGFIRGCQKASQMGTKPTCFFKYFTPLSDYCHSEQLNEAALLVSNLLPQALLRRISHPSSLLLLFNRGRKKKNHLAAILTHPAEHIPREPFPTTPKKIKALLAINSAAMLISADIFTINNCFYLSSIDIRRPTASSPLHGQRETLHAKVSF